MQTVMKKIDKISAELSKIANAEKLPPEFVAEIDKKIISMVGAITVKRFYDNEKPKK